MCPIPQSTSGVHVLVHPASTFSSTLRSLNPKSASPDPDLSSSVTSVRDQMEQIEGAVKSSLSAAEKKGVRIMTRGGGKGVSLSGVEKIQAVAKLFYEKLAHPESLEQALGPVWCPMKGIHCKSLDENRFLITFHQASGKKKAIEEGPWNLSKEILVVREIDELEFAMVPMWVQVSQLPIGMMNAEAAEIIGDEIGEFMDVDTDDGKNAVGSFLRLKVRIDIRKPLMRGVTVIVGSGGKEKWCPLAYEHLPDFCYSCGLVGHTAKLCSMVVEKGQPLPYDRNLRVSPPKKKAPGGAGGKGGSHSMLPWQTTSGGSGSKGSLCGSLGKSVVDARSNALSWRKDGLSDEGDKKKGLPIGEDKEVTSPMKKVADKDISRSKEEKGAKKNLYVSLGDEVVRATIDPIEVPKVTVGIPGAKGKKWTRRVGRAPATTQVAAKEDGGLRVKKRGRGAEGEMVGDVVGEKESQKKARKGDAVMIEASVDAQNSEGPADRSCDTQ